LIRRFELTARGFEIEADMFAECVKKNLRIAEIPITYRSRYDRPKLSSLRDGLRIGAFLLKKRYITQQKDREVRKAEQKASEGFNTSAADKWRVK
jgi:hypothetical protein